MSLREIAAPFPPAGRQMIPKSTEDEKTSARRRPDYTTLSRMTNRSSSPEARKTHPGERRTTREDRVWHSEVGHGAIDVVVAGGGEVARDLRFLDCDRRAGGDV